MPVHGQMMRRTVREAKPIRLMEILWTTQGMDENKLVKKFGQATDADVVVEVCAEEEPGHASDGELLVG